jgi:uncharacterized protein
LATRALALALLRCCGLPGEVGWDVVKEMPDALASLRADLAELGVEPEEAERQIKMLHPDGNLTGYLFRCLHCGELLAYSDAS